MTNQSLQSIKTTEITLRSNHDGLDLGATIIAPSHPQAILQFVHGMTEHRRRYYPVMQFFAERGFATIIHDHRGHGDSRRTDEDYGYFYRDGTNGMIDDTHQVTEYIKARYPDLPLTLLGHSMGSMVVRCYLKKYDAELNGLIVCGSPSKQSAAHLALILAKLLRGIQGERHRSKLLNRLAFQPHNKKFKNEGLANAWLVSDPEVVKAYNDDPASGFIFTLNGFENLFRLMLETYSKQGWQLQNPNLPIFFIAGEDDPCIINPKAFYKAVDFLRSRGYKDIKSKLYPGMRHEILNEKAKLQVWQDIATWIQQNNTGLHVR